MGVSAGGARGALASEVSPAFALTQAFPQLSPARATMQHRISTSKRKSCRQPWRAERKVATFWSAHSSYRKVLFLLTSVGGVSDLFCQTTDCCFCLIVYLNQDQCFNHACFLSRGVTTCQKANTARTGINWREQAVFHDMHSKSWCTLTYLLCPRHPFLCSSQHAC